MEPILNIAVKAARKAGSVIVRSISRLDSLDVTTKGPNDFVSEVDRQAEAEIIKILRRAYPSHGIMAEEGGNVEGHDDFVWIIDPLDGTTNYLHGFPQYAVSIALKHKNRLECGVIYDPLRQELFTAARGTGAQLNDRRIRVSKSKSLDGALLGTGFPFRELGHLDAYIETFRALISKTAGVRRAGAATLDLAYVACGRLDGFWEFGLKPWDMAAGVLLIKEAGGIASDLAGGNDFLTTGNIIAANPKMLKAMLQVIQPLLPANLDC